MRIPQLGADVRRLVFFGFIFLLALIACPVAFASDQPKRIVLIHSFGRDFKPWSEYARAIREELERQTRWRLDIMDQLLASARVSGDNPEGPFINYLEQLYATNPLDLVITIGAPAANFVQRHRHKLFSDTPVLMAAVNQHRIRIVRMTENDTIVAVNSDHLFAFESMLRVLPATKNVMVVIGNSPSEKILREALERELKPLEGRIKLEWTDNLSFEELLKSAATLPPHSAVYWYNMSIDAAGVGHEGDKALTRFHAVANAPIFSHADAYFGRELLGGPMQSVAEGGRRIASVAVRILGGEKAGDIKTPASEFSPPKYDWRQLQRWGISESRLPPGSEVLFRSPIAWEQYRWHILAITAVLLLQAAMITWLLYEHRHRRRSEAAAHALGGRLITAHEEERARLARDLHDDVTQRLAVLAIDAGREERKSPGSPMRTMREGLVRLSEDVHALSYRLHPSILEDLGLAEALKSECERFSQTSSTRLETSVQDLPETLPHDVALCLFRIAQEGMRNIARHAGASRAEVRLQRLDGGLQLTVKDDGTGFDVAQHRTSLGHAGMRQRVVLLGGTVDIDSRPGQGTTILAWVPLREEQLNLS